jgi:hypothetical protein
LTANAVGGAEEAHYGDHRYMISVYAQGPEDQTHWPEDLYMTIRKYEEGKDDVLASEKPEILARLRRIRAARKPN